MKIKKLRIICIFTFLIVISLSFITNNESSANEKENLVFDPYEVANARYLVTSVKGQIELGVIENKGNRSKIKPVVTKKKTVDLRIDDVEYDTKLNALFVRLQDFFLYVRFNYDKDRKMWIIGNEYAWTKYNDQLFLPDKYFEYTGWQCVRDEYSSNLDIDEFGFIREFNFKYTMNDTDNASKRIDQFELLKKDKNFSKAKFPTICSKTDIRITFKKTERD